MRPPCEIVVRSVLPAFRSLISRNLIEKFNFFQVAAAQKLGTTQASVSNYLYSKRGEKMAKQLESSSSVQIIIEEIAEGIATDKVSSFDAMLQFCRLCKVLRSGNMICEWHKEYPNIPESCNVCPT